MVYGDRWREHRRIFQRYFHSKNIKLYHPIQMEWMRKMLPRLLEAPSDFLSISRQSVVSHLINLQHDHQYCCYLALLAAQPYR